MVKKRRKSRKGKMPAALKKYWAAKRAGKAAPKRRRKSRKSRPSANRARPVHRKRHSVRAHRVGGYRRPKSGRSYTSNPMGGIGKTGSAVVGGLIAVGVLFGSLFAVGYLNGLKNRVPMLALGWGSLAAKLAIGLGVGMTAVWANRKGWVSGDKVAVISAAGFAPLGLDLLARIAPGIAGQITLADEDSMDAEMAAELGQTPGNRLSDNTIDAEMAAEMGAESESSSF